MICDPCKTEQHDLCKGCPCQHKTRARLRMHVFWTALALLELGYTYRAAWHDNVDATALACIALVFAVLALAASVRESTGAETLPIEVRLPPHLSDDDLAAIVTRHLDRLPPRPRDPGGAR